MTLSARLLVPVLALGVAVPVTVSGVAAQPARTAIETWLADLDAQPDVSVGYDSLTFAGDIGTLTGLTISGGTGPDRFLVAVDTATIAGYRTLPPTGFAFNGLAIDRLQVQMPTGGVQILDLELDGLTVPSTAIAYDEADTLGFVIGVYNMIAGIKLNEATIGRIDVAQFADDLLTLTTYHDYTITGVADGRIASTVAGPVTIEAPGIDGTAVITVDRISGEDTDIGPLIRLLDPATYEGGVGDMEWATFVGADTITNLVAAAPGIGLRIREVSLGDLQVRQPQNPIGLILRQLADPNLSAAEDQMATALLGFDVMSAFAIGEISLAGLDIFADDVDRFHLGEFHIHDLSVEGLGEIGFGDLDVVIGGEGWLSIDSFALGGLVMPSLDVLRAAILGTEGFDADDIESMMTLVPTLGYVELAGVEVGQQGQLPVGLDRFQLTMDGFLGPIPTAIGFAVEGLRAPLSLLDVETLTTLAQIGFTGTDTDLGLELIWDEQAATLALQNLHIRIEGAGEITADLVLGGVTREMMVDPEAAEDAVNELTLVSATMTVTDETLVDRIFEWTAAGTNVPVAQARDEFIRGFPFLLQFSVGPQVAQQIGLPVQQFLLNPGTATVTLNPPAPVRLATLPDAILSAPWDLFTILGFGFEIVEPGPAPAQ